MTRTSRAERSAALDIARTQPVPDEHRGYEFEWREGWAHGFVGSKRWCPVPHQLRGIGEEDQEHPRDAWDAGRDAAQRLVKLAPAQLELVRAIAFSPKGRGISLGSCGRSTAYALVNRGLATVTGNGYVRFTALGDAVADRITIREDRVSVEWADRNERARASLNPEEYHRWRERDDVRAHLGDHRR